MDTAAWCALSEAAVGPDRRRRKITAAISKVRRHAWAHGITHDGAPPPVRVADRRLEGVICIRLDATVVTVHSDQSPGQRKSSPAGSAPRPSRTPPEEQKPVPMSKEGTPGARGTPATRPDTRATDIPRP